MKNKPLKNVLAERLAEWMALTIDLDTQVKLAERSGIGQSSVQRILNAEVNPTLNVLESLADAFGKQVSDLISNPDVTAIQYDRQAYSALPEYEKVRIEAFIKHAINQYAGESNAIAKSMKTASLPPDQASDAPSPAKKIRRSIKATAKKTTR